MIAKSQLLLVLTSKGRVTYHHSLWATSVSGLRHLLLLSLVLFFASSGFHSLGDQNRLAPTSTRAANPPNDLFLCLYTVDFAFVRTAWNFPWSRCWLSVLVIRILTSLKLSLEAGQLFCGVIYKIKRKVALYSTTENSTLFELT